MDKDNNDLPLPGLLPDDPQNLLSPDARRRILRAHGEREAMEWRGAADGGKPGSEAELHATVEGARLVLGVMRAEYIAAGLPRQQVIAIMRDEVEAFSNSKEFSAARRRALDLEFTNELTYPEEPQKPNREATRNAWREQIAPGESLSWWRDRTGVAYQTLQKYFGGVTTNRTPSVRADIAKGISLPFSMIPE